jgi:hypothetical protein
MREPDIEGVHQSSPSVIDPIVQAHEASGVRHVLHDCCHLNAESESSMQPFHSSPQLFPGHLPN